MKKSNHIELRALLRQHPDGLTVQQICVMTGKRPEVTRRSLHSMPDVYRDRWNICRGIKPAAVYIAVHVPDDCPRPEQRRPKK